MYELLHARGVRCMISAAPVYDKLPTVQERASAYRKIIAGGADVLESDYPVEVGEALKK
jgi:glycerophosphoryl diester phosphodiesterase